MAFFGRGRHKVIVDDGYLFCLYVFIYIYTYLYLSTYVYCLFFVCLSLLVDHVFSAFGHVKHHAFIPIDDLYVVFSDG